ncbi:MAG: LacI family transcriptional regulator [bacterium]|nr:LacI family transcriptional regulator [bacterium]
MKTTIYDIARMTGVSTKTVSRIINDEPHVAQATRDKVLKVIEDVGYQPHIGARSLRSGRCDCVGMTFSAPVEAVPVGENLLSWLFGRLYTLFGTRGYSVNFDFPTKGAANSNDYARSLTTGRCSALIIVGPFRRGDTIMPRIHRMELPYMAVSSVEGVPGCSQATVDFEDGVYQCTQLLAKRGHKRIALLTNFEGYYSDHLRREGYRRALQEAGIEPRDNDVHSAGFTPSRAVTVLHRILSDPEVTGLIDTSMMEDGKALREGARRAGRTLGKDLEVIPWSYTDGATVLREATTHMWSPLLEAASEGLEHLAEWIGGSRQGPIDVTYRPILYEASGSEELPAPRRVFELSD